MGMLNSTSGIGTLRKTYSQSPQGNGSQQLEEFKACYKLRIIIITTKFKLCSITDSVDIKHFYRHIRMTWQGSRDHFWTYMLFIFIFIILLHLAFKKKNIRQIKASKKWPIVKRYNSTHPKFVSGVETNDTLYTPKGYKKVYYSSNKAL